MKLLTYVGRCSTVYRHGVKFTNQTKSVLVSEEVAESFISDGTSLYDDIIFTNITETDITGVVDEILLDVAKTKAKYNLEELAVMCKERSIDSEGSKTELATRIVEYETSKR